MVARRWVWGALAAAGVLWALRAGASPAFAGYAAESARTATRLPREEREARGFLRAAAAAGRVELEASRLAAGRAHSPQVLAFAGELQQFRSEGEAELLHLLHVRGMAAPMLETAQRKALVRLARLSGAKFERAYARLVRPEGLHEQVELYEQALQDVADPVLKAWIERQLPLLRQQQLAAQRLPAPERVSASRRQRVE